MPGLFAIQNNTNGAINPNVQSQFQPQPNAPQQQAEVEAMNALAQQQYPTYTGDPTVDRYIHMFIGK